MTDNKFRQAIFDALTDEYESLVPAYEIHTFSDEFEKKMKKLISRQRKPYYPMIKTTGRKVAAVITAAALLGGATVAAYGPARNAVKNFIINRYASHSEVKSVDNNAVSPETIQTNYDITYDLKDYEIIYEESDSVSRNITYRKGEIIIDYFQYVKCEFDIRINTENAEMSSENINGCEAVYYFDNNGYHNLIWDNGEYEIMIASNIGKSELIQIAESVQKAE